MERLTFEGNFCEIARCKEVKCPYDTACSQKQVWERLKQYEDTKRTPEQIEALEAAIMGKAVAQITEFEGLPIALPAGAGCGRSRGARGGAAV